MKNINKIKPGELSQLEMILVWSNPKLSYEQYLIFKHAESQDRMGKRFELGGICSNINLNKAYGYKMSASDLYIKLANKIEDAYKRELCLKQAAYCADMAGNIANRMAKSNQDLRSNQRKYSARIKAAKIYDLLNGNERYAFFSYMHAAEAKLCMGNKEDGIVLFYTSIKRLKEYSKKQNKMGIEKMFKNAEEFARAWNIDFNFADLKYEQKTG